MSNAPVEDLKSYRVFGLTLLQLMAVLAVVGIILALCIKFYS
jgi:Tfp pilus assembly protein PilE